MTTPNIEELIDRLYDWHNTSAEQNRLDMQKAADLLQSQAERIKVIERESEMRRIALHDVMLEADQLRAQLAEIEKTEPVAWLYTTHAGDVQAFTNEPPQRLKELCKPVFNRAIVPALRHQMSDGALIDAVANSIAEATRPMPADVRCKLCNYQHGHSIGCENNPVDIALSKYKGAK